MSKTFYAGTRLEINSSACSFILKGQVRFQVVSKDFIQNQWVTVKEASEISGKSINAIRLLIHRGKLENLRKVKGKGHGEWLIHRNEVDLISRGKISSEISDNLKSQEILHDMTTQKFQEISTPMIPLQYFDKKQDEWYTERDQLMQGLMMYRYKFEEMDRKMRLLPGPPECMAEEIRQRNEIGAQARKDIKEKDALLQEKDSIIQQKEEAIQAEMKHRKQLIDALQEKEQAISQAQNTVNDALEKNKQYEASMVELQKKLEKEEWARETLKIELEQSRKEAQRTWWKKLLGLK